MQWPLLLLNLFKCAALPSYSYPLYPRYALVTLVTLVTFLYTLLDMRRHAPGMHPAGIEVCDLPRHYGGPCSDPLPGTYYIFGTSFVLLFASRHYILYITWFTNANDFLAAPLLLRLHLAMVWRERGQEYVPTVSVHGLVR